MNDEKHDEPSSRTPDTHDGHLTVQYHHDKPSKTGITHSLLQPQRYRNDLLAAVGFFELTNALDFPANVWNMIPTPMFAKVLMGLGGSICFLWTTFAIWDLLRSHRNLRFLRRERRQLKERRRTSLSDESNNGSSESRLIDAWLDVNYRELGWEYVDRAIMDGLMGVSGVLVGIGTMLAIRGDIPSIFLASNLLSGYIGNSFIAAYAVLNTAWSVYMWRRASQHLGAIARLQKPADTDLRQRMQEHAKKHKIYATTNIITLLVSSVGSLISATKWPGYVIIAPCILGSVFANFYWRRRLGYSRISYHDSLRSVPNLDLRAHLDQAHALSKPGKLRLDEMIPSKSDLMVQQVLDFFQAHGLVHVLGDCLLRHTEVVAVQKAAGGILTYDICLSQFVDQSIVLEAAQEALDVSDRHKFRERERHLLELYGSYLCATEASGRPKPVECREQTGSEDLPS